MVACRTAIDMKGFRRGAIASTGLAGGMGTPGLHSYWRINITANNGDGSNVTSGKVYMYNDFDRINKAIGGTPVGSGAGVSGNVLANSFNYADANIDSIWIEAGTSGYIGYHFASPVEINGIFVRARHTALTQMLKDFSIDYSDDGSSWTQAWSETGKLFPDIHQGLFSWNPAYVPSYTGSKIAAVRYWRTSCYVHTADTFTCAEQELALTPAGSDETGSGTASASNQTFGAASNAYDNNNTTFWAPASSNFQWLKYDFGSGVTKAIAEMRWKSRSVGSPGQNPKVAEFQFSADDSLWHPAWIINDGVTWTDGMQKTFLDPKYV